MGKTKKKAGLASSTVAKKKKVAKVNPFEIRFTREKHSVVNRKKKASPFGISSKSNEEAVGRPGISRSRAIQKRKDTLLQEFKRKNKSNVFVDQRIGEKDVELSAEDKMIARFTAERMKVGGKKNIFNLGEEEGLTHFGKSITDLERFEDDPRSDDEDADGNNKKLNSEQHFGGFLTQNDLEFSSGKANSRKDWIEQMIADSKLRKVELQKDKEESLEMTRGLDSDWKAVLPYLHEEIYGKKRPKSSDGKSDDAYGDDDDMPCKDPYNILMREMSFNTKKAMAADRLKTDEEIVQEAKEKLTKLEEERQRRMKEDGDDAVDEPEVEQQDAVAEQESESEEEEEEEGSDDNDDNYSDLEENESEDEQQKEEPKHAKKSEKSVKPQQPEVNLDLPYTFSVPKSYEGLGELFEGRDPGQKATIIERMIKCNHPQFGGSNKTQLEGLFTFLLQHIHDCSSLDANDEADVVDDNLNAVQKLTPFLYDLAKFSPQPSGEAIRSVLQETYEDYCKSPRSYPSLESLMFLKLTTLVFPTSDYRHPVATPALQWMSHMLTTAKPFTKASLASGLFVATIFTEAVTLSKRYSPELMNFLTGVIFMAVPKDSKTVIHFVPPFKVVGKESTLLADKLRKSVVPGKLSIRNTILSDREDIDPLFASCALKTSLELLHKLADLWSQLSSAKEIFCQFLSLFLDKLDSARLHSTIIKAVEKLKTKIKTIEENTSANRTHIVPVRKKEQIKMLRLYDPELDDNFDPFQKKRVGSKDKLEMQKLTHKMKREKKGAKKDLRADTAFLAKQKFKEQREKDAERMAKTKRIMSGLGGQEGEYRQFQRQKKKKKF